MQATLYHRGTKLVFFTFSLAFIVIMLGAYTRLTNAGLSCPDWPHCYGFLTAPHTDTQIQNAIDRYPAQPVDVKRAWTEMTHRYFAGIEGLLILFVVGKVFFTRAKRYIFNPFSYKRSREILYCATLVALLALQITLGMLTVTEKLKPIIVLAHLLTGISILSVLWCLYLQQKLQPFFTRYYEWLQPWLWLGFFVIAAQITLGGWVSTHYAGLACVDFPYCNGKWLPNLQLQQLSTDLITIHMLHRIGALITGIYIGFLSVILMRQAAFRAIGFALFVFLLLQISLGILNIIWLRPVGIALCHQFVAILLLLTMITALIKSALQTREYRHG